MTAPVATTITRTTGLTPVVRRRLRWAAFAAYGLVLALWTWQVGFPTGRIQFFVWAWAATVVWRFDQPGTRQLAFVRDWWLPTAVMLLYTYSRGIADNLGTPVRWEWPIHVDRLIGGGVLPTTRLQEILCGPHCATSPRFGWAEFIGTSVYASHFVAAWVVAVLLWLRNRDSWLAWMKRLLSVNVAGIVAAIAVPMAPPWLASQHGYITPEVMRVTSRSWTEIGLNFSEHQVGPYANTVAAMPSVHTATAALISLYAILRLRSAWRWASLLYLGAMCFWLVYFGEHYVVDEIAGIALAVAVLLFWGWRDRRRPARLPENVGGLS
jgi:membrane-associated phospholipid phosphatase